MYNSVVMPTLGSVLAGLQGNLLLCQASDCVLGELMQVLK
jgi:hypothetical protein